MVCACTITVLFCGVLMSCHWFISAVCVLRCPCTVSLLYRMLFLCLVTHCFPAMWHTFSLSGHKRCILLCDILLSCREICFLSRTVNILCFTFIICNISACDLWMLQITDSVNYRLIGFVPSSAKCELFAHENVLYLLNEMVFSEWWLGWGLTFLEDDHQAVLGSGW